MSVSIIMVTPAQDNVKVEWQANPMPLNTAVLYVAANQADLNSPNGMSAPADQSAILPATPLTATIPGLNPGTTYFCMGSSDGNFTPVQSFATTGSAPVPVAHLDARGEHGHHGAHYEVPKGQTVELKVHADKIGSPHTHLPGINVSFAVTSGQANGQLAASDVVSDAHGKAIVGFKGTQPGQVQITASSTQADNKVILDIKVNH